MANPLVLPSELVRPPPPAWVEKPPVAPQQCTTLDGAPRFTTVECIAITPNPEGSRPRVRGVPSRAHRCAVLFLWVAFTVAVMMTLRSYCHFKHHRHHHQQELLTPRRPHTSVVDPLDDFQRVFHMSGVAIARDDCGMFFNDTGRVRPNVLTEEAFVMYQSEGAGISSFEIRTHVFNPVGSGIPQWLLPQPQVQPLTFLASDTMDEEWEVIETVYLPHGEVMGWSMGTFQQALPTPRQFLKIQWTPGSEEAPQIGEVAFADMLQHLISEQEEDEEEEVIETVQSQGKGRGAQTLSDGQEEPERKSDIPDITEWGTVDTPEIDALFAFLRTHQYEKASATIAANHIDVNQLMITGWKSYGGRLAWHQFYGASLLHLACSEGDSAAITMLVSQGGDVMKQTLHHETCMNLLPEGTDIVQPEEGDVTNNNKENNHKKHHERGHHTRHHHHSITMERVLRVLRVVRLPLAAALVFSLAGLLWCCIRRRKKQSPKYWEPVLDWQVPEKEQM